MTSLACDELHTSVPHVHNADDEHLVKAGKIKSVMREKIQIVGVSRDKC